MGLIYLGPVSTIDVKFDLVSIFKRNGLNQMAEEFHQQLDELGADLRQFFNDLANDPIDDLDFAIGQDVDTMITVLHDDLILFEQNLRKAVSDELADSLNIVVKLFEKLKDTIKQSFDQRISGQNRPNQSLYGHNSLSKVIKLLAASTGTELTRELEHNFSRFINELYREVGIGFDEAMDDQLNRLGGRDKLPEKYRYLIDFDKQWDQLFGQIQQTFKKLI
ncbi:uncharacterized protein LOC128951534 [Oppia nitens]|uniref:uncharacterized protein LOC128951534 n=1 Tax=Oppia nitens TaxID=1686743 RepID=UPI0023D9BE6E|nr:uncharacterized protein LOC128951534 [Oppia nitens]